MSWLNGITFAIAYNTFRGFSRDRIFHATLLLSVALVLFSYGLSTLTMVEAQKILLDFGFTAISISGVVISVFLGISAVSREIESKAIYTMLSKPISRVSYLLGKFLGCAVVVLLAHVIMSLTLTAIAWSIGTGLPSGLFTCFAFMALESLLLLSVALFSSIFSSSVLATSFTIGMFLIGRSAYFFDTAYKKSADPVQRVLFRVLHDVLPNLDRFNVREVTAYSKPIPAGMALTTSLYCLAYVAVFLALSALLFRKKDMP